jgi:hypothetical protein
MLHRCAGQHSVRGATKEKFRKLDELKARRKAKDEKKRVRRLRFYIPIMSLSHIIVKELTKARSFFLTDGHGD